MNRADNRALLEWYLRKEDPDMPVHNWELKVQFEHHHNDHETVEVVNNLITSAAAHMWAILGQMPSAKGRPHIALGSASGFTPYKDVDLVNAPPITEAALHSLGISLDNIRPVVETPEPTREKSVADDYDDVYAEMAAMAREDRA